MCVCHNISYQCGFGNLCRCKCMCVKNEFTINKHCYFFNLLFIIFYQLKIENKLQFFLEILFIFLTKKHNFSLFHDFYLACQLPCQLCCLSRSHSTYTDWLSFHKIDFLGISNSITHLDSLGNEIEILIYAECFSLCTKNGGKEIEFVS